MDASTLVEIHNPFGKEVHGAVVLKARDIAPVDDLYHVVGDMEDLCRRHIGTVHTEVEEVGIYDFNGIEYGFEGHFERIAFRLSVLLYGGVCSDDIVLVLCLLEDERLTLRPLEVLACVSPEDGFVIVERQDVEMEVDIAVKLSESVCREAVDLLSDELGIVE